MKCYKVNPFIFSLSWDDPFVSKGLQTLLLWWKLSLPLKWDGLTPLICRWHSLVMIPRYACIHIKEIRYFINFNWERQIKADCCILWNASVWFTEILCCPHCRVLHVFSLTLLIKECKVPYFHPVLEKTTLWVHPWKKMIKGFKNCASRCKIPGFCIPLLH